MNTANLQLEGLLVAISTVMRTAMQRGFVNAHQIASILDAAEKEVTSDEKRRDEVTPAQLEAICFPIRYLRLAATRPDMPLHFSDMAAEVGRSKPQRAEGDS